jgi:hypothetical protein
MLRKPLLLVFVACFATIVNLNPYPLFLGASLIFGMSIALMTLFFAGGWWGAIVAIPASLATVYLWGHPYSCLIFLLEALVLTLLVNGRHGKSLLQKGHIIIVDFLFWLVIGSPLYYFTHRFLVGIDHDDAFTIAQKALLNGVLNVLIAYIVYSAYVLLRNRRIQDKATISIQALSLSTSYCLIVLVSLFIASHLSRNLAFVLADRLHTDFLREASYISEVLIAKPSIKDRSGVIEYLKRWDSYFTWKSNDYPNVIFSSTGKPASILSDAYTDATKVTRISARTAQLAEYPNTIRLLMPKNTEERILLKRYSMSYWQGIIHNDNDVVTMIWPAEPQFKELGAFYESMLNSLIYTFTAGIAISATAGFALDREFSSILRSKRIADALKREREDVFLRLSPVQEIQALARKVNERTVVIQNDKIRIQELNRLAQQQLSTAGEIQQCFLGSRNIERDYPDVSLFMRPAYNAGGDWYDSFDLCDKTFLVVADVCDKGVGAALFMSVFRSLIRYSAESFCLHKSSDVEPLDEVITSVNNYMSTEHGDAAMFATVFIACIDTQAKIINYVLAGHEEPILLLSNGESYKFKVSGPAIGCSHSRAILWSQHPLIQALFSWLFRWGC